MPNLSAKGNNISRRELFDFELVGEGSFGYVYKARLDRDLGEDNPTVAVKILINGSRQDVFEEKNRMAALNHPNILQLVGLSPGKKDSVPWLVTEYMPFGDLQSYLQSYGGMPAYGMIKLAFGVACGMSYLHNRMNEKHGDLAARNCLVGPNWSIKIGDFGRLEAKNKDNYYVSDMSWHMPCPIRWMPAENVPTITRYVPAFTKKGDIWSYGVLLFEIWTQGSTPYGDMDDNEVIMALSYGQNPMDFQKVRARSHILQLMEDCFEFEPSERPSFKQIKTHFDQNESKIVLD